MYHIIHIILSRKMFRKSKNFHEQNVLRIRFYICYANFITIGEPPYRIICMKNIIVIISKNKSKIKKFS